MDTTDQEESRLQGLPPVIDASCRMLILGSMPGVVSLSKQEYYGHPRNHFWPLLYAIWAEGRAPAAAYRDRLNFALKQGVGLWDVLAGCEREGSLDADIRKPEANDFILLLNEYPSLERVFFNGKAAEQLYRKQVLPQLLEREIGTNIRYHTLPSSSPARAMSLQAKLVDWRIMGDA
ncbi:G/U mismatch-specific uracil-DNA glycosylase [Paenibacillus sp. 1_12]|uniref:DNA-deoxyinosine glycosylase n=1 Tax=Paenibacillus sp. 1_12 TaxID=1566278 RepID=UPI0008E5C21A|nr:DNA-deoxyinosine glycosylase [Paenibacillus sp. 1_12]SFL93947.1 G/U mismatch-specific uracil-DNA glycosylase [Paenibacillus sp. 1_12]